MCVTIAFPSVLCVLGFPSLVCCNIFIYRISSTPHLWYLLFLCWRLYVCVYVCMYLYSTNGLNGVICRTTDSSILSPVSNVCISLQSIYMPQKPVPSFWEDSNELSGFIKAGNCLTSFKVSGFDGGVCSHYGLLVVTPHSLCCGYQHFEGRADPIFRFRMSRIRRTSQPKR